MKQIILYLSLLMMLSAYVSEAQNPFIQHYTAADGLPSDMVYQVYQDSKKFLWFPTDDGIARFDGRDFVNYRKKDGLNSNEVIKIKEDARGRLWMFYMNGTLNYIANDKVITAKEAPYLDSLKCTGFFRDFLNTRDKTIYFHYNYQHDIYSLDSNNRVLKHKIDLGPDMHKFPGFTHRSLTPAENGKFILWDTKGIFLISKDLKRIEKKLNGTNVYAVFHSRAGITYVEPIFTWDDLFIREEPIKLMKFRHNQLVDSIILPIRSKIVVSSVIEDSQGNLWVSTFDQGVFCVHDNKIILHLPIREALSLLEDTEKNIWVSSMKDGVYKINPNILTQLHFPSSQFDGSGLTALSKGPGGGVFLSNGAKIWLFNDNEFIPFRYPSKKLLINRLYFLKDGKMIWGENSAEHFASENITLNSKSRQVNFSSPRINISPQAFKRIAINRDGERISSFAQFYVMSMTTKQLFSNVDTTRISDRIQNIFYNARDELIVNASKNLVLRNKTFTESKEYSYFNGKKITDHKVIDRNNEIINIEGDSLFLLHQGKHFNLTSKFNLPGDLRIKKIEYAKSILVLASGTTLFFCYHPLNIPQGLPVHFRALEIKFRNLNDILLHHDSLFIASDDGLTILSGMLRQTESAPPPIPYFQSININDSSINPGLNPITFRGKLKLSINFGCINYSTQPVTFSYMMEGLDQQWNEVNSRSVVYQHLPVGKYTFLLKVRKPDSSWSDPVRITVEVLPTFWQHPLFFALAFLLIVVIIVVIILRRKQIELIRYEREHQLISLEQKALLAMMNPHFIFNSLGSIQNYLLQNKSSEAASYLSRFAKLIRQNLNATAMSVIPLSDEAERLRNYLDLEQSRMENKFTYVIEMSAELKNKEIFIPSMSIQPFLENAIWHGISLLKESGWIRLSFEPVGSGSIIVKIEDNGIGVTRSAEITKRKGDHLHMSLELTRKRLEILGKKHKSYTGIQMKEINPGEENPGTLVTITLPTGKLI